MVLERHERVMESADWRERGGKSKGRDLAAPKEQVLDLRSTRQPPLPTIPFLLFANYCYRRVSVVVLARVQWGEAMVLWWCWIKVPGFGFGPWWAKLWPTIGWRAKEQDDSTNGHWWYHLHLNFLWRGGSIWDMRKSTLSRQINMDFSCPMFHLNAGLEGRHVLGACPTKKERDVSRVRVLWLRTVQSSIEVDDGSDRPMPMKNNAPNSIPKQTS